MSLSAVKVENLQTTLPPLLTYTEANYRIITEKILSAQLSKFTRRGATTSLSGGALCFGAQRANSKKPAHRKVTGPLRAHLFWKAARRVKRSTTQLSERRHNLLAAGARDFGALRAKDSLSVANKNIFDLLLRRVTAESNGNTAPVPARGWQPNLEWSEFLHLAFEAILLIVDARS